MQNDISVGIAKENNRTSNREAREIPHMWKRAVCTKDCPDTCGLLVHVENGKITSVKGDPDHPFTAGFICRKAGFFPEHVHSSERITTPLKRIGPKGTGRFKPVSWNEALDEVAFQMKSISAEYGSEAILPYSYAGHMGLVHRNAGHAFFNRIGASRLDYTICGPAATAGYHMSLGSGPSTEIQSAAQSDYIIIWGSNTLTTNVHAWPYFKAAQKAGATLAVIDPYRNRTARQADLHVMIKPGTDAALALAMMQVLIDRDLIDHDFISRKTIGFERLKERTSAYTPDRAAKICGLSEEMIVRLALGYGRARAPYIRTGWGPARQLKGAMAMRTIALLPALVGAFDKPGGGITRTLGGALSDLSCLTRPDLRRPGTRTVNMVELGNALTRLTDPPVKLLHVYLSNPAVVAPQSREVLAGLAREDLFVVVQEMFRTDTARYADIVLPGSGFLEVADLYQAFGHNYIQMARPVIPPVGQSRSTLSIFQDLAARLGFTDDVFSLDETDFINRLLSEASPYLDGVDFETLKSGRAVRVSIPSNPYEDGFNTPSGKVEFYSQKMADQGLDPLPDGQPLRDPDGEGKYGLEFITPPHHLFLNSAFNEIGELREKAGPAQVMIHPETARKRGIADGDPVRVFNDRGECRFFANVTDATQADLLVAEGLHWPSLSPGGGANQLTSQRLTDMGETCAFHCNRVDIQRCDNES
ncbi:MAG: molybdopterin oxidoreductase family protein [Desulfobacterales bacterium]|nr:molybdopterin oxidoreductase family protein [Desulfobacterales bacterium]